MTKDQEHIVTMLLIKHGGFEAMVDFWLYSSDTFSQTELEAVDAWLACEQAYKPHNLKIEKDGDVQFVSMDFPLNIDSEIDWPSPSIHAKL